MSSGWFEEWEKGFERRLRRKNSPLAKLPPDLLEAYRQDIAFFAGCPRIPQQMTEPVLHVKRGTGKITEADRKFANEIGLKFDANPTGEPRRRKTKPGPPSE